MTPDDIARDPYLSRMRRLPLHLTAALDLRGERTNATIAMALSGHCGFRGETLSRTTARLVCSMVDDIDDLMVDASVHLDEPTVALVEAAVEKLDANALFQTATELRLNDAEVIDCQVRHVLGEIRMLIADKMAGDLTRSLEFWKQSGHFGLDGPSTYSARYLDSDRDSDL